MLKEFKEENKRKKQIIIFTCVCIFLITVIFLYQSFALFETNEQFNVVSGKMENPGDISFAFYINDEIVLEAPEKDSGLALDKKSSCTNGVSVSWNVETWNAKLDYSNYKQENISKIKCNLYFRNAEFSDFLTSCGQNNTSATECMKKYSDKDTVNLTYDETTDNNLRYIGAEPNNYVWFNEELWRIIGVMENISDKEGNKKSRMKLIRSESIGNYSYNAKDNNSNSSWGVNEWGNNGDLMQLLNPGYQDNSVNNSLYWERKSGFCINGRNSTTISCDFTKIGLKESFKKQIEKVIWNTGSNGNVKTRDTILANEFYKLERSENTGKICTRGDYCNDTITRTTTWTGQIGLMYPSDYAYATSGNELISREICLNTTLWEWNNSIECARSNWLYKENVNISTITPCAEEKTSNSAFCTSNASIKACGAYGALYVYPVLYLLNNIKIISGQGTQEIPYQLSEK